MGYNDWSMQSYPRFRVNDLAVPDPLLRAPLPNLRFTQCPACRP